MINIADYILLIQAEKHNIVVPPNIVDSELIDAYRSGRAIENILLPIFNELDADDLVLSEVSFKSGLEEILEDFQERVYEILENEKEDFEENLKSTTAKQNLFEVAGTINLYLSNKYTRVISENFGHRLEDIATLSPRVINPETHLGFKIKGIDVIIFLNNNFYFCQLKTKKDTLTGSQKGRSESELEIHPRSLFVACFSLGRSFTFNTDKPNIERKHGAEFWDNLGIDYTYLTDEVSKSLNEIEAKLFDVD